MKRFLWFIIGASTALLVADWYRLRVQVSALQREVTRAVDVAEHTTSINSVCISTLSRCEGVIRDHSTDGQRLVSNNYK